MFLTCAPRLTTASVEAAFACLFSSDRHYHLPILTEREDGKGWEFQGGKAEVQDSCTLDTAVRECMEELQLVGDPEMLFGYYDYQYVDVPERLDNNSQLRPAATYHLFCLIASEEAMRQINAFQYQEGVSEVRSVKILDGPWPERMSVTQRNYFVPVVTDWMAQLNCE